MTNSMLHWPLVRLSQSLFQHLRTYIIKLGQTQPLCHFYIWAYESYHFFFTIFIANLNKSFRLYRGRESPSIDPIFLLFLDKERRQCHCFALCYSKKLVTFL